MPRTVPTITPKNAPADKPRRESWVRASWLSAESAGIVMVVLDAEWFCLKD
jgi:hypothetical protein